MGWWQLPRSTTEMMGDEPADAAAGMLEPIPRRTPLPTLDELLDAIEAGLAIDGVTSESLDARHVEARPFTRTVGAPGPQLVELLRPGLLSIAETYRERFERLPTVREVLAAISFVLCPQPTTYVREPDVAELEYDLALAPA